jgi:hypothetical protein
MKFQTLRGKPLSIITLSKRGMLLLLALLLMVVAPVHAKPSHNRAAAAPLLLAQIDGAGAARIVERSTGGKVLSVNRQEKKGRIMYRVKVLLPEGRVRTVMVDAETGRMGG